jgi:hypothetical protein
MTATTGWSWDTVDRTVTSTQKSVAQPITRTRWGRNRASVSLRESQHTVRSKFFSTTISPSMRSKSGRNAHPGVRRSNPSAPFPQCPIQMTLPPSLRTFSDNALMRSTSPCKSCLGAPRSSPICMSTTTRASTWSFLVTEICAVRAPVQDLRDPAADPARGLVLFGPDRREDLHDVAGVHRVDRQRTNGGIGVGRQRVVPLLPVFRVAPARLVSRNVEN